MTTWPTAPRRLHQVDQNQRMTNCEAPAGADGHAHAVLLPPNPAEDQYLRLVRHILERGERRPDRTGTGTLSVFAPPPMRFPLREGSFPLFTTKRVLVRAVVEELLWFVRGDTDAKRLSAKGVRIWDGNASRQFLDSRGLHHRREGDLGPVYGFQWRHFGARYVDCETDYTDQGVDQLAELVRVIRENPYDRRIILSAWNPSGEEIAFAHRAASIPTSAGRLPEGASKGRLSCLLYQRSCDMGLGVPFNVASYALLTRMIAHVTDLEAGELVHTMGDAHVYLDHVEPLREQLEREPRPFPKLIIRRKFQPACEGAAGDGTNNGPGEDEDFITSIDDFRADDFVIEGYNPHPPIKMAMSV
ncbi:MAG: thymidylate synthase/dCMP hydroxymethylase domain-containing protein [Olpidium bornovanus]|uniref:thymidylate synthase n=1 Tax=Olpidium bornovanus TaxID=278681 RepID=A0A8H8A2M1_9FUNG|nr:MAG: thymidylate synthase/dCMP hydroxymethylase domain-containing protein [Olpidium bornovanus]